MNEPRHHHFVSSGYLSKFADGFKRQAKVFCVDLNREKEFRPSVRNIGGRRDYNRVEVDDTDPNVIEKALSELEDLALPAIDRIVEKRSFEDPIDRSYVLQLMAVFAAQHPHVRGSLEEALRRTAEMIGKAVVSKREIYESTTRQMRKSGSASPTDVTYEEVRDFVHRGEYDIMIANTRLVEMGLKGAETIYNCLQKRDWLLLLDDTGSFITSDNPVVLDWIGEPPSGLFPSPGYGLKNTCVLFSISRYAALIGLFDTDDDVVVIDPYRVAEFNSTVINFSMDQVYALNNQFPYLLRDGQLRVGSQLLADHKIARQKGR